ncbi:exodeoxyribonuclease VII, large subunit [Desulfarculus baarsii DSM 2075]|uniref:Exodeoxyribonuclease 7 large subunit n=1 Tax=Desulfarculus baarsii (strain ATCC 33931 / DSM 2075 / LMG 7858 / VKM B-1802 / 2st14) TaxID=644282 RepID=E1QL31_DESB2|nr:exodeoxyribonuclease VII large subunit [Desulfarculus baarsii]ADK85296.1 exodeoxyribonuclease VII, large subunit [Desulfarculus baarsii DSM 2075]
MEGLSLFTPRQVLGVSELLNRLKKQAEASFDFVWVEGEVSGLRRPASGHCYFSLKDDGGVLRAVMFRHQAGLLRFRLEDGQRVLCQGRLSVYVARGEVQLVVDTAEPLGAGALALAFEQLKRRLAAQGVFDAERKKPLPELPRRVAVVTSPTGAALRDFLKVVERRGQRLEVAVYPVQVQGEAAAGQMVVALAELAAWGWPEVIVLTRGGGSPEDLWAYNDEALALAIAACPLPVVSAVGHEIDVTIADLAADLRAPTPTAAAELLLAGREELTLRLKAARQALAMAMARSLARRRVDLRHLRRAMADPRRRLADHRQRLDDVSARLLMAQRTALAGRQARLHRLVGRLAQARPERRLTQAQGRLEGLRGRLWAAMIARLRGRRAAAELLRGRLRALGPLAVLGRGYALVFDEKGRLLREAAHTAPGRAIEVKLQHGALRAVVEEVVW